ncbi:MCM DNA helicase complex subunit [Blyttiomyces sp. JEL0837]|nr:MCM DNA helicase complex subunit [Blyttiomyces sp. JEL0837]
MEKDGREERSRTVPITPRTLETMIRLSTAHAKARLASTVTKEDTEVAAAILEFALYQKMEKKSRRKRQKLSEGGEGDETDEDDEDGEDGEGEGGDAEGDNAGTAGGASGSTSTRTPRKSAPRSVTATPGSQRTTRTSTTGGLVRGMEEMGIGRNVVEDSQDSRGPSQNTALSFGTTATAVDDMDQVMTEAEPASQIDDYRYQRFLSLFRPIQTNLRMNHESMIAIPDLVQQMNSQLGMSSHFTVDEMLAAVRRLTVEETNFMYDGEIEALLLI